MSVTYLQNERKYTTSRIYGRIVPYLVLFLCCMLITHVAADGNDSREKTNGNMSDGESAKTEKETQSSANSEDKERPDGDPFSYHSGTMEVVSDSDATVPSGIQLRAILSIKGKDTVAAIHVPQSDHIVFVREDDVVQVLEEKENRENERERVPIYIQINRIRNEHVEISPHKRPENKQILR
ncbi:MAG: hypothetical protein ACOCTQ_01070 [Planctomycetota bacterium]